MKDPIERLSPLLTGLVVLLLYLAVPSYFHNFDGVACAIAVELGDFQHLVHGNHLLYGLVGYGFHWICALMGLPLNALWSLQLLDSLLGAMGAATMHALLRRLGFPQRSSVFCALGMALSYGYWLWSLEAQVYLLGLVLLLFALSEALRERPSPYRLALWHALAMLAHGANALFLPVALYALWRSAPTGAAQNESLRGSVSRYLVCSALIVLGAYMAAGILWVRPSSIGQLRLWLLGSAALGPGRSFSLSTHMGPDLMKNLRTWLAMSAQIVSPWNLLALPPWIWALRAAFQAQGTQRRLAVSATLWLPAYALLFIHWEPYTMVYRVVDLVPLWGLAAVSIAGLMERTHGRLICSSYLILLFAANLICGILPTSRPENNRPLQQALWLGKNTPQDAWIAAYDMDQVYVPYFAHRHPLNLSYFSGREPALTERVRDLLRAGLPVYITSEKLEAGWDKALASFRLRRAGRWENLVLYQLYIMEGKTERQKIEKVEDGSGAQERTKGNRILPLNAPA